LQNSEALKLNSAADRSGLASSKDALSQNVALPKLIWPSTVALPKSALPLNIASLKVLDALNIDA